MRYDFTRCNNLRWRIGSNEGFIKTAEGRVCLLADKLWLSDRGRLEHRQAAEFGLDWAETWLDEHPDFEIIPRNPETYKDWHVGDVVVGEDGYDLKVEARLANVVFFSWVSNGQSYASDSYYICDELYRCGYRLVLTDYEKELAEAKETQRFSIKSGDKVVWRDPDNHTWDIGVFLRCHYETGMTPQYEVRQLLTSLGISFMCRE